MNFYYLKWHKCSETFPFTGKVIILIYLEHFVCIVYFKAYIDMWILIDL